MESRTFTTAQIVLLSEVLRDTIETCDEIRSELIRDEGETAESVRDQDAYIAELIELIKVVQG